MFDVFYDDDYISVGVEWRNNEPFFHHHVKKWNTTANRVMMREVENLIKQIGKNSLRAMMLKLRKENNKLKRNAKKVMESLKKDDENAPISS